MQKAEKRAHSHPMPGWIAVIPMEMLREEGKFEHHLFAHGGDFIAGILAQSDGMQAGIVLEIGHLPDEAIEEGVIPYTQGATVYWPDSKGILIGGYTYLQCQSVICWDDPPE
jgi:hypothetical protein